MWLPVQLAILILSETVVSQQTHVKNGTCPDTKGMMGTCVESCQTDRDCHGMMKCCSNGCGHVCMKPVVNPCQNITCPLGQVCKLQKVQCIKAPCYPVPMCVADDKTCTTYSDCLNGGSCYKGKCICFGPYYGDRCQHKSMKNGTCPDTKGMMGTCVESCQTDSDCHGMMKCCSNGCGHVCMKPVVNPCQNYTCSVGKVCKLQQVECVKAPCPPVPMCVSDNKTCTTYSDCLNGGSCSEGKCICFGPYYGDRCQHKSTVCNKGFFKCSSVNKCILVSLRCNGVDDCGDSSDEKNCSKQCSSSVECHNGGTCYRNVCWCAETFYGDKCQNSLNSTTACKSNYDCYHGGSCINGSCNCKPPHYGYACLMSNTTKAAKSCREVICKNGGTCYYGQCYCQPRFFGITCQFSVNEDIDTYRKFRSEMRLSMQWKESYSELSNNKDLKQALESILRGIFAGLPNFEKVEVTSFRQGSVIATYTAHFTDIIDKKSAQTAAQALDNIVVAINGTVYTTLPFDDCRSAQHSCIHGQCERSSNGSYECICLPNTKGKRCEANVCADYKCLNGFRCFVNESGKAQCTCPYEFGPHCDNVPCGCNPHTHKCILRHKCVSDICSVEEVCVEKNYTGSCTQNMCVHGTCIEGANGQSICKCHQDFKGATCNEKKSVCDMLPMDICAMYGGRCVGDIFDGRLCDCPVGRRGAFCERNGNAITRCQRQSDLYETVIRILNGSLTIPAVSNASAIVRVMVHQHLGLVEIQNTQCTASGDYSPKQCSVNIYNVSKSHCYCVNSDGMQLTEYVPQNYGYPPCTGHSVSPFALEFCGSSFGRGVCQNGGTCQGDIMSPHPKICACQEGFTGILCERRLKTNEKPETYTKCTFGSEIFDLFQDIVKGKIQFFVTVHGSNVTVQELLPTYFKLAAKYGLMWSINYYSSPTSTPSTPTTPSTPGWEYFSTETTPPPPSEFTTPPFPTHETTPPPTAGWWKDLDGGFTTETTPPTTAAWWEDLDGGFTTETTPPPTAAWWETTRPPPTTTRRWETTRPPTTRRWETTRPPTTRRWETTPPPTTTTRRWETTQPPTTVTTSPTLMTTPNYDHFFVGRSKCNDKGEFEPMQCEFNIVTGKRGACFCVDRNGTVLPGSKTFSPKPSHCKFEQPDECPKKKCLLTCEYGYLQDVKGCDMCLCRKPCHGKICAMGEKCVAETVNNTKQCKGKESCEIPVCRKMHKPGLCPADAVATMSSLLKMFQDSHHTCDNTCHDDADCEGTLKCCGACGNRCVKPFAPKTCLEKKEIMGVYWALFRNMSDYVKNTTNVQMANSTYPLVLQAALSWLQHISSIWLPNCTHDGNYQRVQCEYNIKTNAKVKCFCVDDDGIRDTSTDTMPPKYPVCNVKSGICPPDVSHPTDVCSVECLNDFGCSGAQKCCSSGCNKLCRQPLNYTVPDNVLNMNTMLNMVCEKMNACLHGYCSGNLINGDMCSCNPHWTGVTCSKRGQGEKLSSCEKRKYLFRWFHQNQWSIRKAVGDNSKHQMLTFMDANCSDDGKHYQPMQCDKDLESGKFKWCYCVYEDGRPIKGTEVNHPQRPECGGTQCPNGNQLIINKMELTTGFYDCNSERPCPDGYECSTLAYGKKVCCPSKHGLMDICNMTYNQGKQCDDHSGKAQQTRYYYNHRDGLCHEFTYMGCSGNENNFVSKESCEKRCHRKEKPGKCPNIKTNVGKFGYCPNKCKTDRDCEGNNKCCMTSCGMKCSVPSNSSKPVDICQQPAHTGPCRALMHRFFFNSKTQQCETFNYGGCQGNGNNFNTLEECCNTCGGNLTRCKRGRCPKPKNYFASCSKDCDGDADCHGRQTCCFNGCSKKCTSPYPETDSKYNCFEAKETASKLMYLETGTCNIAAIPRCNKDGSWKKQQCQDALGICWCVDKYGTMIPGTKTRGVANCDKTPDHYSPVNEPNVINDNFEICPKGVAVHCCNASMSHLKSCPAQPSAVSRINPCGGCRVEFRDHDNNIVNCNEGLSKCQKDKNVAHTYRLQHAINRMPLKPKSSADSSSLHSSSDVQEIPAVCLQPAFTGRCRAYIPSWFYNATSQRCEMFIYGGCETNGNKFETAESCYSNCNKKASPCEIYKCKSDEKCVLAEDESCSNGKCNVHPVCKRFISNFYFGGVYEPQCNRDQFALRQCHQGYCWCVSKDGVPVEGSVSKGLSLVCEDSGKYKMDEDSKVANCPNGKTPNLKCLNSCLKEVCPGHPQASCVVDLCDDHCDVSFVQNGKWVTCGDDVCSILTAEPSEKCPAKTVCPSGQVPPMCDPRSCSDVSCPNNPCAVCTVDPCSCRVQFVDLLTKKKITDCKKVTHTLCEMETCRKYSDKAREELLYSHSDVPVPTCTKGLFEPKQCVGDYCWCVDGFGRKTTEVSPDEKCANNDTVSVTAKIKFNQPFSRIEGRYDEFEEEVRKALEKFSLDKMLDSIVFKEGSIICVITFVPAYNQPVDIAVVSDFIIQKVKNEELVLHWDGEEWTADKEEISVAAQFRAQRTSPHPEEEDFEDAGLSLTVVIILATVGSFAGFLIIFGIAYVCCCRRSQTKNSQENLYETEQKKSPPFAVSNALYDVSPNIQYVPYVVENEDTIKVKL